MNIQFIIMSIFTQIWIKAQLEPKNNKTRTLKLTKWDESGAGEKGDTIQGDYKTKLFSKGWILTWRGTYVNYIHRRIYFDINVFKGQLKSFVVKA